MLARIWWKEYRVFRPVWLIMLLAAGLLQWLFVSVQDHNTLGSTLTLAALCWAVLYAFASGAAAFSAERESMTLGFLDALPVPRGRLWLGKVSFTMASTFTLGLLLAGIAALGPDPRDRPGNYGYRDDYRLIAVFATVLFDAACWSLFWSSVSRNPLLAAVMGVLSVYASLVMLTSITGSEEILVPFALVSRFGCSLVALAMSGVVMTWSPSARSSTPKVRAPAGPRPVPIRASSIGRSLTWQAAREGWTTWLLVALVGLVVAGLSPLAAYPVDGLLDVILAVLVSLVAGVSVFGTGNASGPRRFLVQHGARPGTVWWRKLLVWALAVGSISALTLWITWNFNVRVSPLGGGNIVAERAERLIVLAMGVVNAFAVGVLCGMTIYRRITATLVGVIVLIAVFPLQYVLFKDGMIPSWSVALVPLIFIGVSRIWAADWLFEREGAGPWIRLATGLLVPFATLGVGYSMHRGFGVPDVGPQYVEATLVPSGVLPPDQDAALAYRRAASVMVSEPNLVSTPDAPMTPGLSQVLLNGWDPRNQHVVDYWSKNREAIELARKASAIPRGRFQDVGRMDIGTEMAPIFRDLRFLDHLLTLDTRERLGRGDLPAAWEDILALFRLANQLGSNSPTQSQMAFAAQVHHRAVGLAFEWLGSLGQTPAIARRALADLKALPPLPDARAMLQVEASIIERSLDMPGVDLAPLLPNGMNRSTLNLVWYARVVAAPWERQRARRIARLMVARDLAWVGLEDYQRPTVAQVFDGSAEQSYLLSSTLARMILSYYQSAVQHLDEEQAGRRALEQASAVVVWKLEHDGKEPETLEALVPSLLDRLPVDPFSGYAFHYIRSDGRPVLRSLDTNPRSYDDMTPTRVGQYLIYSVGPDRQDNGGLTTFNTGSSRLYDLLYAVP